MSDSVIRGASTGALLFGLLALFLAAISTPAWDSLSLIVPGVVLVVMALFFSKNIASGALQRAIYKVSIAVLLLLLVAVAVYMGIPGK